MSPQLKSLPPFTANLYKSCQPGRRGAVSEIEWLTAEQLGEDNWLYIVTDALESADLHLIQDSDRRLPRKEVTLRVSYRVSQER